jgi:hypothetical protein
MTTQQKSSRNVPLPTASLEEVSELAEPSLLGPIIEEEIPPVPTPQPSTSAMQRPTTKSEPEPSDPSTIHTTELLSALKAIGKSKPGKLKEPEPFSGKDPKKLKSFIFQCQLYFRSSTDYDDDSKKVTFALSYLRDVAQQWFEPAISGLTDEPPVWLEDWEAFLEELRDNFGPYDETADAEHELTNLKMKDNQRISDYMVRFNALEVLCPWGEHALRYRFYEGLPTRIKDELSKGEGKPRSLIEMRRKAQNIDHRYWERQQERSREQPRPNPSKSSTTPATTSMSDTPAASSKTPARSDQKKPDKPKDSKPSTPRVDLTGKLDSHGKLTQQERQRRIDKNLCLFCGGQGHRTDTCPVKAASAKARAATTVAAESSSAPAKAKEAGAEKKKD